jgi:uracil DNA glycosylase
MLNEDAHDGTLRGLVIFKNTGRDLLDGISKANKLCFTFWGKRAAPAVQMVHCDAANLARDHPSVMRYHRKFKHHSVSVVTGDTSPRERH